ncbi:MAG: aminopeptidase [Anaerolineales bacterium]|nr:aminopeptidase [Anaerolineales bacterium]TFH34396.1 MAG: aminopeptidase [Anaerolineales bacterium]
MDPRIANIARIMVEHSLRVEPKQRVHIGCWPFSPRALPYLQAITRAVLKAGAYPLLDLEPEFLDTMLLKEGNDDQLAFIDPRLMMMARDWERSIVLICEENTRRNSGIDPKRQAYRSQFFKEYFDVSLKRSAEGDFRWVLTNIPTPGYAQDADMSLEDFEDFFFHSTFADTEDPIAAWQEVYREHEKLVAWLAGKRDVVVKGENIDLKLSIEGRPFINCYGDSNLPDGEIFTSPVEDSVEGWVRFTYPAIYQGREFAGVELRFEKGRVVKATAEKNQDYLDSILDIDAGARTLGEFAIGTNRNINRFVKNITFDEKLHGTVHMALGFGYPESGSKNESSIHWDMICDMTGGGQILVDGELFYDSGDFKL